GTDLAAVPATGWRLPRRRYQACRSSAGPCSTRSRSAAGSGRWGGRLDKGRVPGVVGDLVELAFPQGQCAVEPGAAAVVGCEVEGRRDPLGRVALTGADTVAAAFEPDAGTVGGSDSGHRRYRAHGAARLFEQGPFERAGQLRPVDRAVAAADEGPVALAGQRRHAGLVVEFCVEEGFYAPSGTSPGRSGPSGSPADRPR